MVPRWTDILVSRLLEGDTSRVNAVDGELVFEKAAAAEAAAAAA